MLANTQAAGSAGRADRGGTDRLARSHGPALKALPLAGVACLAVLGGRLAPAGEADARAADLAVARSAIEQGLLLFAQPVLEKLQADEGFASRDEATLLLARCLFGLRRFDEAARLLDGYERSFPGGGRFFLQAAYWLARADLERSRSSAVEADRRSLLARARKGFERVLAESADPEIVAGARFFLGAVLYEAGEHEKALSAFRRAEDLGVNPSETEPLALYLGHCQLKLRNFAEAARAYATFIERFPQSKSLAAALYGLGESHYYLEEWQEAASAYGRSRDAALAAGDPDAVRDSRYARGWALAKLGEKRSRAGDTAGAREVWKEALKEFEALLGLPAGPIQTSAVFESGEILYKLGRHGEAAERLLPLADSRRYPAHAAAALYLIGRSRAALGQMPEAIQALTSALDRAGARGELERRVRFALAEARAEIGDTAGSQAALAPLASGGAGPSVRAEALFEMARIARDAAGRALREGRPEAAAALHAQAYDLLSQLASDQAALAELPADEVYYWRARSADDRARAEPDAARRGPWVERALESYRAARTRAEWGEWTERALFDEAALHVFRGDIESAAAAYRTIIEHGDLSAEAELEARLRCADAELELGRPQEARKMLAPILEEARLAPGRAEAAFKAAVALAREDASGQRAAAAFREYLRDYPGSRWEPGARAALGDSLVKTGRHAEALAEYEAVLASFPDFPLRDAVELAAGHAARASGDAAKALSHYKSLFARGADPTLRARAKIAEGEMAVADRPAEALALAQEALAAASADSRASREAEELRGRALFALGRFEEAASAFGRAAADPDPAFRTRARHMEASALAAWGRSGRLARPADALRKGARLFTWVAQSAAEPQLRESAIFAGAEALMELASAEEAEGRRESALRELEEARRLLGLSADKARASIRLREIDERQAPRSGKAPSK